MAIVEQQININNDKFSFLSVLINTSRIGRIRYLTYFLFWSLTLFMSVSMPLLWIHNNNFIYLACTILGFSILVVCCKAITNAMLLKIKATQRLNFNVWQVLLILISYAVILGCSIVTLNDAAVPLFLKMSKEYVFALMMFSQIACCCVLANTILLIIKKLRDLNFSMWLVFLVFTPYVGILWRFLQPLIMLTFEINPPAVNTMTTGSIVSLIYLCFAFANLCLLKIRRLHDINLSAWWFLVTLIPYIGGGLLLLITFVIPGTKDNNKYGAPDLRNQKKDYLYLMLIVLAVITWTASLLYILDLYT